MTNRIPLAYADLELQLSTAVAVGATSFTLSSATDDDGNALPAGKYCFTIDNGSTNKEYLLGQLNGTTVTSVVSVSRQGVETSGAARAHRVGAPAIVSDFATIQRVADILRGQENLDGDNPVTYDAEPTLVNREELATVGYVLDQVNGGTVDFDNQIISSSETVAGETISAGDLVFFQTSDQEWYQVDADTAAEVNGVQLGIALGAGTDGVSITGGVQISGVYTTTGLTAGDTYYASNTPGAIANSAGTNSRVIGVALSTTKLLLVPVTSESIPTSIKEALNSGVVETTYNANDTWTKPSNLRYVRVQLWGGGGSGVRFDNGTTNGEGGGGGGGGYFEKIIDASDLGVSETVTVGAGGAAKNSNSDGDAGGNSSFGSHATAYGGGGGSSSTAGGGAGGGGGAYAAGGDASGATNGAAGDVTATAGGTHTTAAFSGGGGGECQDGVAGSDGGNAVWGGGGGAGAGVTGASTTGGTSTYGGNGGAGSSATGGGTQATDGTAPGGGGGARYVNGSPSGADVSGAGGTGRVIVTEYYI